MNFKKEAFETICEDGVKLKGTLLLPDYPKAVVQFNGGTATRKEFYLPFLSYLANHGYLCCLWSYRGTEPGDNLKDSAIRYADYGLKDMPAIKAYLENRFPDLQFLLVGHSAGGQQIGFMEDLSNVKGNINISVSAAYFRKMPLAYRLKAYFFFYLFAPISSLFNGYVRAKPYGFMENLPKPVVYEWRDWLEVEEYFFDKKFYEVTVPGGHFKNFKFPIQVYYSTDDSISNQANTEAFWRNVKSEKAIKIKELKPEEFGLKKIDHFGYFRKGMKDTLWKDIVKEMDGMIAKI